MSDQRGFGHWASEEIVRTGVIGAGQYATAIVTQSPLIPYLDVPVVADVDVAAARRAYRWAGFADEDIVICGSHSSALTALEQGHRVVLSDALEMMDLPLDVVVEATGEPETGARHALAAIEHGKHVAMVNKETDVTVGPILKHLADQAGVVYTAVEGDQHGLLIRLVTWARVLGLTVWCGGKSRDTGLIFDPGMQTLRHREEVIPLDSEIAELFGPVPTDQAMAFTRRRLAWLGDLGAVGGYDLVELTIVANATGLVPDIPSLHHPVLRTVEIPEVLCPVEEGGILRNPGAVEVITHLAHPYGVGLGGGVFIVVGCANDYSRSILVTKGLVANQRQSAALIYRPYHLCGVETPISILNAAVANATGAACAIKLLKIPTGAETYLPRFDVVARAAVDLKAGEILGDDHSPKLDMLMQPAHPINRSAPLPLHMANGNRLAVDVPAGKLLTVDMVTAPSESILWDLRTQQDHLFLS